MTIIEDAGPGLGVIVLYMITLANLPNVAGPLFLIPMGVMGLAVLAYAAVGFAGYWKIVRSSASDRKRRVQGRWASGSTEPSWRHAAICQCTSWPEDRQRTFSDRPVPHGRGSPPGYVTQPYSTALRGARLVLE